MSDLAASPHDEQLAQLLLELTEQIRGRQAGY